MKPRTWLILLAVVYAYLRWVLLLSPGYVYDMNAYKRWALRAAQEGISQVYATSDMDYPPLYAWILAPVGTVYGWIEPRASRIWTDREAEMAVAQSRVLNLLIKLPPLLFDLGIAWLLWRIGARADARRRRPAPATSGGSGPGRRRRLPPWSVLLPAAYLLNPAVLMDGAYWGQPDSILSFFVLAAFLALGFPGLLRIGGLRRRTDDAPADQGSPQEAGGSGRHSTWPAWVLLTLATLMKPLGAPFFPLLLVLTVAWYGWREAVKGGVAAVVTALVVFAPFILSGQTGTVFQRVVGDVGLMPFTSSNAHNLWWALGAWKPADVPVLGPLTLTHLGLAAFLLFYAAMLDRARRAHVLRREEPAGASGLLLALGVAFSFFMLSTHMHENHLFLAVPLAVALAGLERPGERILSLLAVALTVGVTLNLILHDLYIPERFPFTAGGPTTVMNLHLKRPFYAGELAAIRVSVLWNLALFGAFLWAVLRPGSLLAHLAVTARTGHPGSPPSAGRSGRHARRGSC